MLDMLTQSKDSSDPVIRHMVLLIKLHIFFDIIILDIASRGSKYVPEEVSPELIQKIHKLIDEFSETKKDINDLSKWIMERSASNNADDKNISVVSILAKIYEKMNI